MRIILADELTLVRAGIRALLQGMAALSADVVAETGDGRELIDLCNALKPDLVITEVPLQGITGVEACQQLRRELPGMATIFLSAKSDSYTVRQAMATGATGYVVKNGDPVELLLALKAAAKGQRYSSPSVSGAALERRNRERSLKEGILSGRQRQVLRLIGQGKSTREISELLNLSIKTVETHRARTANVLGLQGTNALMHFAIKCGMDADDGI